MDSYPCKELVQANLSRNDKLLWGEVSNNPSALTFVAELLYVDYTLELFTWVAYTTEAVAPFLKDYEYGVHPYPTPKAAKLFKELFMFQTDYIGIRTFCNMVYKESSVWDELQACLNTAYDSIQAGF